MDNFSEFKEEEHEIVVFVYFLIKYCKLVKKK